MGDFIINFESEKVIRRVPETVTTSTKVTIIEMIDNPGRRQVIATMYEQPGMIVLWEGDAYDAIGNWTNEDVIARINEIANQQ